MEVKMENNENTSLRKEARKIALANRYLIEDSTGLRIDLKGFEDIIFYALKAAAEKFNKYEDKNER